MRTSAATTARTATSAKVKRQARPGGKCPQAAQERLRSMLAGDLGREPPRRWAGFLGAGRAFLASIRSWGVLVR